jgi:hypothetical protein
VVVPVQLALVAGRLSMMNVHVPSETVAALSALGPEHAAALYDPQTVVKLAREVEILRRIAENIHPCECLKHGTPGVDPTVTCKCVCHRRIEEALIIWNPDRLPDRPDVQEAPPSE